MTDDHELRALKAAVFGRDAVNLPASERAELESRLAGLLAAEKAQRATVADDAPRPAQDAVAAGLLEAAEPVGEQPAEQASEPVEEQATAQAGSRWRKVVRHPLAIAAVVLVLIAIALPLAVQVTAEQRDSLAVFEIPPNDDDLTASWMAPSGEQLDSRLLDRIAGFTLHGALRESGEVCLIAMHSNGTGAATCVTPEEFAEHGILLPVVGSANRTTPFQWGPRGPVQLVPTEATVQCPTCAPAP